jgi:cystathionine gamma-synthase
VDALDRSTIWPYDEQGEPQEFFYQRYAHPTGVAAEHALGDLDGGTALLFSSGMGATTALALQLLGPGASVAVAAGAYFGTARALRTFERWGVTVTEFDQKGPPPADADVVWLEVPSNPLLEVPDFEAAAAHRALVVVDATVATPVHVRPLEHGADYVLHSATKYLSGHDDVLLGAVVCNRDEDAESLRALRGTLGIVAAPDPCWLLLRSLKTLRVRQERQTATARELARRLQEHSAVRVVRYPGFGGLLSFDVDGGEAARRVETATKLIRNATSLGGVDSSMESRHRWEGDRIPTGLLRLSVGLEDVDELWTDLAHALDQA